MQSKPYPPARITVYRDHPEWDKREKWWMMPSNLLQDLFVARYTTNSEDGDLTPEDIAYVEHKHPGCVYIY